MASTSPEIPLHSLILESLSQSEQRIVKEADNSVALTIKNPLKKITGFEGSQEIVVIAYRDRIYNECGLYHKSDPTLRVQTEDKVNQRSLDFHIVYKAENPDIYFRVTGNSRVVTYKINPQTKNVYRQDGQSMNQAEDNFTFAIFPSVMRVIEYYTS